MGEIIGFRFGSVDKFAEVVKKNKIQKRPPSTPTRAIRRFTTPGSKPILDLAENHLLEKAVQAATKGSR